jgi:phospholipase C
VSSDYDTKDDSPIGLGYRVPMIIASPWSRGGYVNSQIFDHTSTLMFLEKFLNKKKNLNILSPQISSWRRTVCGDLTSAFRPQKKLKNNSPSLLERNRVINHIQQVKSRPRQLRPKALTEQEIENINYHHNFQQNKLSVIAAQERGVKPACALPYNFSVESVLDKDSGQVVLTFIVDKDSVGVPFRVYALSKYREKAGQNWDITVKSGDTLTDAWFLSAFEDGKYDLAVHGPNGFYRRFTGTAANPSLEVSLTCQQQSTSKVKAGDVILNLKNTGASDLIVQIKDDNYRQVFDDVLLSSSANIRVPISTQRHHFWYNLAISVEGFGSYQHHYAGHIEHIADSFSDSFMGNLHGV